MTQFMDELLAIARDAEDTDHVSVVHFVRLHNLAFVHKVTGEDLLSEIETWLFADNNVALRLCNALITDIYDLDGREKNND